MSEHLEHYGVKGMKWGQRKSRDSGESTQKSRRQLTDAQKKALKAAAIGTAVIGGAFLAKSVLGVPFPSPTTAQRIVSNGKRYAQSPKAQEAYRQISVKTIQRMVKLEVDQSPKLKEARRATVNWMTSEAITNRPSNGPTVARTSAQRLADIMKDQSPEMVRARRASLNWTP